MVACIARVHEGNEGIMPSGHNKYLYICRFPDDFGYAPLMRERTSPKAHALCIRFLDYIHFRPQGRSTLLHGPHIKYETRIVRPAKSSSCRVRHMALRLSGTFRRNRLSRVKGTHDAAQ